MYTQHTFLPGSFGCSKARAVPSIHTLYFVQGRPLISRGTVSLGRGTEEICSTANAVSPRISRVNSPSQDKGDTRYGPQLYLRRDATPGPRGIKNRGLRHARSSNR